MPIQLASHWSTCFHFASTNAFISRSSWSKLTPQRHACMARSKQSLLPCFFALFSRRDRCFFAVVVARRHSTKTDFRRRAEIRRHASSSSDRVKWQCSSKAAKDLASKRRRSKSSRRKITVRLNNAQLEPSRDKALRTSKLLTLQHPFSSPALLLLGEGFPALPALWLIPWQQINSRKLQC